MDLWVTYHHKNTNYQTFKKLSNLVLTHHIEFFNNERVTLEMGLAIPTEEEILEKIA